MPGSGVDGEVFGAVKALQIRVAPSCRRKQNLLTRLRMGPTFNCKIGKIGPKSEPDTPLIIPPIHL